MVAIVGMMGNLAAILILLRPEMKSTFHHSLITLAVVDILFVITLLIDIQRFDLNIENQMFILFFPYAWNPFKNILMTFETFLMVSITTERYLAIRFLFNLTATKSTIISQLITICTANMLWDFLLSLVVSHLCSLTKRQNA